MCVYDKLDVYREIVQYHMEHIRVCVYICVYVERECVYEGV